MDGYQNKGHRPRASGPKTKKKEKKKGNADDNHVNPKAFAIQSVVKAAKKFHRSQDVKTKKIHIPLPVRTVDEPPPLVVGIVGPPKVGKSTLLHCIVKKFCRQKLTSVHGPVTIVSGKKRRLTLIEVNNDLGSMIDIAKVADLVILMVDASFGFEMEIFEFLNICNVHGFPRVMGVLNHLDTFRDSKRLRKTKKRLKDRFWTEIYQGAKLFYLSGMVDGEYQKMEVHNLCRFISVMKFRPLTWQTSHPYLLVDRFEDITPPAEMELNAKCDRRVTLYGYGRGVAMRKGQHFHIPGAGDFCAAEIESLPDPCPTPEMDKKHRTLRQRDRCIYAPMSGVGGILYDKDAVYIDVGDKLRCAETPVEEDPAMVSFLTSLSGQVEHRDDDNSNLKFSTQTLFETTDGIFRRKVVFGKDGDDGFYSDDDSVSDAEGSSAAEQACVSDDAFSDGGDTGPISHSSTSCMSADESDSCLHGNMNVIAGDASCRVNDDSSDVVEECGGTFPPVSPGTGGDSTGEVADGELASEGTSRLEAEGNLFDRLNRVKDYNELIYGKSMLQEGSDEEDDWEELGGLFKVIKRKTDEAKERKYAVDRVTSSRPAASTVHRPDVVDTVVLSMKESLADAFSAGARDKSEDASYKLKQDGELYGDFQDLETGKKYSAEKEGDGCDEQEHVEKDDDADETLVVSERTKRKAEMTADERRRERLDRKRRRKEQFDQQYDLKMDGDDDFYKAWKAELEEQAKTNREEFEGVSNELRQDLEGFLPGLYLRIEVSCVPCEFVTNFNPNRPVVVGGLGSMEQTLGYITARLTKHRWYKKILKNRNPLILSLGWRRFQTMPVFSKQEDNMRQRMLKYSPAFMACTATFWGPITPQQSGLLAVESLSAASREFRVAATGVVLELNKTVDIVKKLKLVGVPLKIFRNTAYIKAMFNTAFEVSRFEGAKISTVSKIRGIIKKPAGHLMERKVRRSLPPGTFRATFEDQIKLSDIVFLNTWVNVDVPTLFNHVTDLLGGWRAMKSVGQLRHEQNLPVPQKQDSLYQPVNRPVKRFTPLMIPKSLQSQLPFRLLPSSQQPNQSKQKRVAVVLEPHESKKAKFLHQLTVVHEHSLRTKHAVMRQKAHAHRRVEARRESKLEVKRRVNRKELFRVLGKMQRTGKAARSRHR